MTTFLRWAGRLLILLLVAALVAIGLWLARFEGWRKDRLAALADASQMVETKAGPIEYVEAGSGPAVLVLHGAPGGYDQAALIGANLARNGFRVIAPSRPGFLRTPLATGLLFEEQADALAELLTKLGVDQAAVVGFSTGAPVAVQFALRHPDRTTALALLSPITKPYQRDPAKQPDPLLPEAALFRATGDIGSYLVLRAAEGESPKAIIDAALASDVSLEPAARGRLAASIAGDAAQRTFFGELMATQAPLSPRESGTRNDLLMVRALPPIAYEKIGAPTLIISGREDLGREWTSPQPIVEKLPGARVRELAGSGHLVWFGPEAASAATELVDFLRNPPAATPLNPAAVDPLLPQP